jgi:hypothetical protein
LILHAWDFFSGSVLELLTSLVLRWIFQGMLKRGLAVLLALLWLSLSAFNALEGVNFPGGLKHHSSTSAPLALSDLLRDSDGNDESAAHLSVHQRSSFEQSPVQSLFITPLVFYEPLKLHKLHRVFLI